MSDANGLWGDADEAMARVDAQISEAQERAQRATEMRQRVDAVRGRASSRRREVSITVDSSGRLVDLELAAAAYELGPRDLSRLIVDTAEAARRDAGQQSLAFAAEAFGEDSSVVDRLRAEIERPIITDRITLQ